MHIVRIPFGNLVGSLVQCSWGVGHNFGHFHLGFRFCATRPPVKSHVGLWRSDWIRRSKYLVPWPMRIMGAFLPELVSIVWSSISFKVHSLPNKCEQKNSEGNPSTYNCKQLQAITNNYRHTHFVWLPTVNTTATTSCDYLLWLPSLTSYCDYLHRIHIWFQYQYKCIAFRYISA